MRPSALLLYLVIMLEGYIVLSAELLAIRQTIPYVGSGTDTVSIIIAAVLMPLAIGYYAGGHYTAAVGTRRARPRQKLLRNLALSSLFLLFGLSTFLVELFFETLIQSGSSHRLLMVTLYSVLFIITPVYLLGQTVPLISTYFSKQHISRITGKMLFFSTIGSFLGSIFSTLVLMSFFGVHITVIFLFLLIVVIAFLISNKKRDRKKLLFLLGIFAFAGLINSTPAMRVFGIYSDNQYNTIRIFKDPEGITHFFQNNSDSSAIGPDGYKHVYIQHLERALLAPIQDSSIAPKNILVIGAGGFTFGLEDRHNKYAYVDIDPSLEKVATWYFLKQSLTDNKKFVPEAAQSFVNFTKDKYDLILLDAFNGDATLPEDLVTVEFLKSIKDRLNPRGVLAINFVISPNYQDAMSRHLENTLREVFPYMSRDVVQDYSAWSQNPNLRLNVLYYYFHHPADEKDMKERVIYTRDKNQIFFDKPQRRN